MIVYLPEGHHTPSEDIIIDTVSNLQNNKPEAAIIVPSDFNQEQFKIHGFTQYVNCNTRQDRKIDLCFCNIKRAYNKCYKKDPLGISDHNNILLLPIYLCKLKTEKPVKILVKQWECDSTEQLQNCLDTTDWNISYSDDVNECVETVSSYIQFCENNIVP